MTEIPLDTTQAAESALKVWPICLYQKIKMFTEWASFLIFKSNKILSVTSFAVLAEMVKGISLNLLGKQREVIFCSATDRENT